MPAQLLVSDLMLRGPRKASFLLFDADFYARHRPEAGPDPLEHFLQYGSQQNASPHPLFDPLWYSDQNPDVAGSGMSMIKHFLLYGVQENRSPHPLFDPSWYSAAHGIDTSVSSMFLHFLFDGESLGLRPHPLFDVAWYHARYRSRLAPDDNALVHYLRHCEFEALDPHPLFSSHYYLLNNHDVWQSGRSAFDHYIQYGFREHRDPHPAFDTRHYLSQTDGPLHDGISALRHYVDVGDQLGFSPHPDFDTSFCRSRWPISSPGVTTLQDYLEALHRAEPRACHASLDRSRRFTSLLRSWTPRSTQQATVQHRPLRPIVMVQHSLPGGSQRYVSDLTDRLTREAVPVSSITYVIATDLLTYRDCRGNVFDLRLNVAAHLSILKSLLEEDPPSFFHVNHILGAHPALMQVLTAAPCGYVVTIHDYYAACPRVDMVDATGRYCHNSGVEQCNRCMSVSPVYPGVEGAWAASRTVATWRAENARFLQRANAVLSPSFDTARRIARHLGVNATVRPHPMAGSSAKPFRADRRQTPRSVVVLGAIGPHKGSALLLDCATEAFLQDRNLSFVLIGTSDRAEELAALPNVTVSGRYVPEDLPASLAALSGHIALFLSVWPETYSYTLTEVLEAGLFPVVLDIGAIAERVTALNYGRVLPLDSTARQINVALETMLPEVRDAEAPGHVDYELLLKDYYPPASRLGTRASGLFHQRAPANLEGATG